MNKNLIRIVALTLALVLPTDPSLATALTAPNVQQSPARTSTSTAPIFEQQAIIPAVLDFLRSYAPAARVREIGLVIQERLRERLVEAPRREYPASLQSDFADRHDNPTRFHHTMRHIGAWLLRKSTFAVPRAAWWAYLIGAAPAGIAVPHNLLEYLQARLERPANIEMHRLLNLLIIPAPLTIGKYANLPQIDKSHQIAVSGKGLAPHFMGERDTLAAELNAKLPDVHGPETEAREGGVLFVKVRNYSVPVWAFDYTEDNLATLAQTMNWTRKETEPLPRISDTLVAVSGPSLATHYVGQRNRLAAELKAELPNVLGPEREFTAKGVRFVKVFDGINRSWAFDHTEDNLATLARTMNWTRKEMESLPELTDAQVSVSRRGLTPHFVGVPDQLAADLIAKLPNVKGPEREVMAEGVRFVKVLTGKGTHRLWAFDCTEGNLETIAKVMGWQRRQNPEDLIEKLGLEEAIALFGSDPLRLKQYIQLLHPELLPEDVDRLIAHICSIPGLRAGPLGILQAHRDYELDLSPVDAAIDPKRVSPEEAAREVVITGHGQPGCSIQVTGPHPQVIVPDRDGDFELTLPAEVATYFFYSFDEAEQVRSKVTIVDVDKQAIYAKELCPPKVRVAVKNMTTSARTVKVTGFIYLDKSNVQTEGSVSPDKTYVQIVGVLRRKVKVRKDGTFTVMLFLPRTGELNVFAFQAVNDEKRKISDFVLLEIQQTSPKIDPEEAFRQLLALRQDVLDAIRQNPGRYHFLLNALEQSLMQQFTHGEEGGFSYLHQRIQTEQSPVMKDLLQAVESEFRAIIHATYDVKPGKKLYFFQKFTVYKARRMLEEPDPVTGEKGHGVIIANEPGLGKTVTALEIINGKEAFIITPNAVVSTWAAEEGKFIKEPNLEILEGTFREREAALPGIERPQVATNVEFTRGMTKSRASAISQRSKILIVDEGDYLGRIGSQQSKGTRMIKAGFRLILTATPFKKISHIGHLLGFIFPNDPRFKTAQAFARAFPVHDAEALNALFSLMQRHSVRVRKQDVFEEYDPTIPLEVQSDKLSRKVEIPTTQLGRFELTAEQAQSIYQLFTDYEGWCKTHRDQITAGKIKVTKEDRKFKRFKAGYFSILQALRQIMDDPAYIGRSDIESPKHHKMDEIVDRELNNPELPDAKVLIFCKYIAQVEAYLKRYAQYGAVGYYGELPKNAQGYKIDKHRKIEYYAVDEAKDFVLKDGRLIPTPKNLGGRPIRMLDYQKILFQNDPRVRVMVATYDTGSLGVTLTGAHAVIYDDLAPTYRDQYQAGDRAHRIDNDRKKYEVRYYWLQSLYPENFLKTLPAEVVQEYFSMGTYDQVQLANLEQQGRIFHRVMDGAGSDKELAAIRDRILVNAMPFLFPKGEKSEELDTATEHLEEDESNGENDEGSLGMLPSWKPMHRWAQWLGLERPFVGHVVSFVEEFRRFFGVWWVSRKRSLTTAALVGMLAGASWASRFVQGHSEVYQAETGTWVAPTRDAKSTLASLRRSADLAFKYAYESWAGLPYIRWLMGLYAAYQVHREHNLQVFDSGSGTHAMMGGGSIGSAGIPPIVEIADQIILAEETERELNPQQTRQFVNQVLNDRAFWQFLSQHNSPSDIREYRRDLRHKRLRGAELAEMARKVLAYYVYVHQSEPRPTALETAWTEIQAADSIFKTGLTNPAERRIALQICILKQISIYNLVTRSRTLTDQDRVNLFERIRSAGLVTADDLNEVLEIQNRGTVHTFDASLYHTTLNQEFPQIEGSARQAIIAALLQNDRRWILSFLPQYRWQQLTLVALNCFDACHLLVTNKVVQNRLLIALVVNAYAKIHEYIKLGGYEDGQLAYPFSGTDASTALLLTNATNLRFYDSLPFGFDENLGHAEEFRQVYQLEKSLKGFNSQSMLSAIGIAKYPILWELEALGATDIHISRGDKEGQYFVDFKWSYDGVSEPTLRRIEYNEKQFDARTPDLEEVLRPPDRLETTILLNKANYDLPLTTSKWPPVILSFKPLSRTELEAAVRAILSEGYHKIDFSTILAELGGAISMLQGSIYAQLAGGVLLLKPRNPNVSLRPSGIRRSLGLLIGSRLHQTLSLRQRLLQKLSVRVLQILSLKLELKLYNDLERSIIELSKVASEHRPNIFHVFNGQGTPISFPFMVLTQADYEALEKRCPHEVQIVQDELKRSGGGFAFYSRKLQQHFLFVDGVMWTEEFIPLVAIHEYGESIFEPEGHWEGAASAHMKATQLEFAEAKRCQLMGRYITWLEENHPVKFANVFTVIEDFDYPVPEEVRNSPQYKKKRSMENETESSKAAHQMIENFEWPEQLLRPIAKAERMNHLAEGILRKAFQRIQQLAEQGPGAGSWMNFLFEMEGVAQDAIRDIGERLDIRYLNEPVFLELWRESRRNVGTAVLKHWTNYQERVGVVEALNELQRNGQSEPSLDRFGIFVVDYNLLHGLREAAKGTWRNYEEGGGPRTANGYPIARVIAGNRGFSQRFLSIVRHWVSYLGIRRSEQQLGAGAGTERLHTFASAA